MVTRPTTCADLQRAAKPWTVRDFSKLIFDKFI